MNQNKMTESERKTIYKDTDAALEKGYMLWRENLSMGIPEELRYFAVDSVLKTYSGKFAKELAAASQGFFWFRYLHYLSEEENADETGKRTLLGDWFFSCFSLKLIPIDSTELIDSFSNFLNRDINEEMDMEKYSLFFESLSGIMKA